MILCYIFHRKTLDSRCSTDCDSFFFPSLPGILYGGFGGVTLLSPPRRRFGVGLHVEGFVGRVDSAVQVDEGRCRRYAHAQLSTRYQFPEQLAGFAAQRYVRVIAVVGKGPPQRGLLFGLDVFGDGGGGARRRRIRMLLHTLTNKLSYHHYHHCNN